MISNILSAQVVKHKKMFRVISCARYVIGITAILSLTSSGLAAQTCEDTPNWQASDQNVHGIDVSHYQGIVNWNEVKQQGIVFDFVKATGGNTYTDPEFADNWHFSREPEKFCAGTVSINLSCFIPILNFDFWLYYLRIYLINDLQLTLLFMI